MNTLFAATLVAHVLFGVIGVIYSYRVLLKLLQKPIVLHTLRAASLVAFISYMASWLSGGYYYVFYYGANVKPVIKEGIYPWAHLIVMEVKEHVFLFLPFATFVLYIAIRCFDAEIETSVQIKRSLILLSATITILATLITLAGIIITGGAQ